MIDDLLGIVPTWLNFILTFPVAPRKTLASFQGTGAVSRDLTTLAVAGVGVAYLLIALLSPPELNADPSLIAVFLRSVDARLLPALLILGFVVLGITIHLAARICSFFSWLLDRSKDRRRALLGGTIHDSVNAMLALSAFSIPAGTALFIVTLHLMARATGRGLMVAMALSAATGAGIYFYSGLALAGTHPRTGWVSAFAALSAAAFIIFGVCHLLTH